MTNPTMSELQKLFTSLFDNENSQFVAEPEDSRLSANVLLSALTNSDENKRNKIVCSARVTFCGEIHGRSLFLHVELPFLMTDVASHITEAHVQNPNSEEFHWFIHTALMQEIESEANRVLQVLVAKSVSGDVERDKNFRISYHNVRLVEEDE